MKRYIIQGIFDKNQPSELYYAGTHYTNTKAFTSSVYMATAYSSEAEAAYMADVLSAHFQHAFIVREIYVTVTIIN